MPLRTWRPQLLMLGLSAFFACLQLRLILMLFRADYIRSASAGMDVLLGQPHWRTFQPRVLGPWIVDLLANIVPGGNFQIANLIFSFLTLTAMGALAWRLGQRVGGTTGAALLAFFVAQAGFAFMLAPHWLYAWDYIDVIIFFVFVDFVVARRPWTWFIILVAIGIYSRQTNVLIAVWMILDGGWRTWRGGQIAKQEQIDDRAMLIAGGVCLVLGLIAVELLTRALLVREIGPLIFPDTPDQGGVIQAVPLLRNFATAWDIVSHVGSIPNVAILIFLGVNLALAIGIARADPPRYLPLGVVFVLHEIATVTFGSLPETRIYVETIPLLVLGTLVLSGMDRRAVQEPTAEPPSPAAA